ncbi:MAG: hypothetical protein A2020_10680 [Lentisphaerae bacterium GWF2_45_14]|nr:MAG: hypothetical protein A2020_10680 [Lentisphaerae bacterium GWF2_45_14]
MQKEKVFAIVMAGGKGERFWPQSRVSHPKQLLRLIGNLTLIEQTVERLLPLVLPENIIIISNEDYVAPMRSLLSNIPAANIIGEPVGRDTAPCIALAAAVVRARGKNDDAVMMFLPADHVIKEKELLLKSLSAGINAAASGKVVTIGVDPSFPSTGYGYIHCGKKLDIKSDIEFFESVGFKEKPDLETAVKFLEEGCYKWNSGMFIWSCSTLVQALKQFTPSLFEAMQEIEKSITGGTFEKTLKEIYPSLSKISIDYAIMEKISNVIVEKCTFDWDDVGSWTALRNQIKAREHNNVVRGLHEGLGTEDCIVVSDASHLIATVDVKDLIIVHTEDATLVCNAKSAQKIKELVQQLSMKPELSRFL